MTLPPEVLAIGYPLLTALLGGIIGWLARGGRDAGRTLVEQASRADEVELFTTTAPNAYPVGKEVQAGSALEGTRRTYTVTRHEELGEVKLLGAESRWPVRIWGVPA